MHAGGATKQASRRTGSRSRPTAGHMMFSREAASAYPVGDARVGQEARPGGGIGPIVERISG